MAKSVAEQRERNRIKQQAYRDKKRGQKTPPPSIGSPVTPTPVVPGLAVGVAGVGEVDAGLEVVVQADGTPAPKLSLKERLLKFTKGESQPATPIKKGQRPSTKKQDNLIVTTLPIVVSALIATYAQRILPKEYAKCAPTREEMNAVLGPIMAIIGRRVEVYGKASQDSIDLANSLICAMAYGVRAYITFVDIKEAQQAGESHEDQAARRTQQYRERVERETRDYETEAIGATGHSTGGNGTGKQSDGSDGVSDNHESDGETSDPDAAIFADMFARDRRGRVRLGLLSD